MKLKEIYQKAIKIGIQNDPRGRSYVEKILKENKQAYQKLSSQEKELFDLEKLNNPYSDTRILWGKEETEVKSILVGIDIEGSEILLADGLRQRGRKLDLVLAHHPEGKALATLAEVMPMQADILYSIGVPPSLAESLLAERIKEVERRLLPANHLRSIDFAKILDVPFICLHTPADNCVASYLDKLFKKKKPQKLEEIVELLLEIPEYKYAASFNSGPKILIGEKKSKAGKIFVDMTGGTEGSKEIFSNLVNVGVATLVCMHLSEEHFKNAKTAHLNVIIAGHIASDTLGLNLLLDELEGKQKFELIECSGFKRFRR